MQDFKGKKKPIRLSASATVNTSSYTGSKKELKRLPIYVTGVRGNDGNASLQILVSLVPLKWKFVMQNNMLVLMKNWFLGYFYLCVLVFHCASPANLIPRFYLPLFSPSCSFHFHPLQDRINIRTIISTNIFPLHIT